MSSSRPCRSSSCGFSAYILYVDHLFLGGCMKVYYAEFAVLGVSVNVNCVAFLLLAAGKAKPPPAVLSLQSRATCGCRCCPGCSPVPLVAVLAAVAAAPCTFEKKGASLDEASFFHTGLAGCSQMDLCRQHSWNRPRPRVPPLLPAPQRLVVGGAVSLISLRASAC